MRRLPSHASRVFAWMAILLISLVLTGCGSSEDYVITGTNPGSGPSTGSVTFNFVKVQAALEVPQSTTDIRFEFFQGSNGTGPSSQPTQILDFAPRITIDPVALSTRSIVVTALTEEGVPLVRAVANVIPIAGEEVVVDFDDAAVDAVSATALDLTPATATVAAGGTRQYNAAVTYSNSDTVDNPTGVLFSATGAATINATTGLATAGASDGTATITATLGDLSDSATLTISATFTPALTTLTVSPDGDRVGTGGSIQFGASGADQNGDPFAVAPGSIAWSSSLPSRATINTTTGLAFGVAEGNTTITATVGTVSGSADLSVVNVTVDSIVSVTPDPVVLQLNATTTQTLVTLGSFSPGLGVPNRALTNDDGLTYLVSGDPGVVTVDNSGLVTAVAAGNTTVTATVGLLNQTVDVRVNFASGGNQNPVVTVDTEEIDLLPEQLASPFDDALTSVTDDQANLAGGRLTISTSASSRGDATLFEPASPLIGEVDGNATSTLTVELDSSATPASIEQFLKGVQALGTATGDCAFDILLEDGQGGSGGALRPYDVIGTLYIGQGQLNGSVLQTLAVEGGAVSTKLATGNISEPSGLAMNSTGDLFVADSDMPYSLASISPAGMFSIFATPGSALTGMTIDADGNLYVAAGYTSVVKVTPSGIVSNVITSIDAITVTLGPDNNLYVGQRSSGSIYQISPAGSILDQDYGTGGTSSYGLAFHPDGRLFVADPISNAIRVIPAGGGASTPLTTTGVSLGLSATLAAGMTFDTDDNLLLTNAEANSVVKVTPGGVVTNFRTGITDPNSLLYR